MLAQYRLAAIKRSHELERKVAELKKTNNFSNPAEAARAWADNILRLKISGN
jgi:hypothetical protein